MTKLQAKGYVGGKSASTKDEENSSRYLRLIRTSRQKSEVPLCSQSSYCLRDIIFTKESFFHVQYSWMTSIIRISVDRGGKLVSKTCRGNSSIPLRLNTPRQKLVPLFNNSSYMQENPSFSQNKQVFLSKTRLQHGIACKRESECTILWCMYA